MSKPVLQITKLEVTNSMLFIIWIMKYNSIRQG